MAEKDNNIFTDEFPENKEEPSEFTKIPDLGEPPKKPEKIVHDDGLGKKHPKRTVVIVGAVIVGVIILVTYYGVTEFFDGEPFDSSQCNFGVAQDLFGSRCMTQEEYDLARSLPEPVKPVTTTKPPPEVDKDPFRDITSASDKVEVTKSKDPIGYFMVTTDDDWYGDFVDFRKIPSKIEKSGDLKVNFRCFTDDFQGTSTYFGTFRNQVDSDLTVEVYINGLEVESQTTTTNKALILEGSCYGHES